MAPLILLTAPESRLKSMKLFSRILPVFLYFFLFCIDGKDNKMASWGDYHVYPLAMENKQGARIQVVFPYCSPEE